VEHKAYNKNGASIEPQSGVVPILKEVSKGKLSVIGTGFYITRYGLFLTARHVLDDLVLENKNEIGIGYILHFESKGKLFLRRIQSVNLLNTADLAIGQADTYESKLPNNPLMNMRCELSTHIPLSGQKLVTYAYPLNKTLDFTDKNKLRVIKSDFYEGNFLRSVEGHERPFIKHPHYETSIEIKSGASGGPVFCDGKVIGVNCRGWDFGENVNDNDHLSSIVPIQEILVMNLGELSVPKISWEYMQIPSGRDCTSLSMLELANYGHVDLPALFKGHTV
jgi:hypothetical protein